MADSDSSDDKMTGCLSAWALLAVGLPVSTFLDGYFLWKLWSWFVVPVFHAPAFSYAAAIGLDLLPTYLLLSLAKPDSEKMWTRWVARCLWIGLGLGIAFLAHLAMG